MLSYKNRHSVLYKAIAAVLVCLFIVNDIAFAADLRNPAADSALAPTSIFNPIVVLSEYDEAHGRYAITENKKELSNFKLGRKEDAAYVYLNLLIGQFLHRLTGLSEAGVSERGINKKLEELKETRLREFIEAIDRDLPHIDFARFRFKEMSWDNNTLCLPYERKDKAHPQIQVLRFSLPGSTEETKFKGFRDTRTEVSIGIGGLKVVLEDPADEPKPEKLSAEAAESRKIFIELLHLLNKNWWLIQDPQNGYFDKEAFGFDLEKHAPLESAVFGWPDYEFNGGGNYDSKVRILGRIMRDRIDKDYLYSFSYEDVLKFARLLSKLGVRTDQAPITDGTWRMIGPDDILQLAKNSGVTHLTSEEENALLQFARILPSKTWLMVTSSVNVWLNILIYENIDLCAVGVVQLDKNGSNALSLYLLDFYANPIVLFHEMIHILQDTQHSGDQSVSSFNEDLRAVLGKAGLNGRIIIANMDRFCSGLIDKGYKEKSLDTEMAAYLYAALFNREFGSEKRIINPTADGVMLSDRWDPALKDFSSFWKLEYAGSNIKISAMTMIVETLLYMHESGKASEVFNFLRNYYQKLDTRIPLPKILMHTAVAGDVSKRDAPKNTPPDSKHYHTPPNDGDEIPGPEDAPADLNQPTPRPRPAAAKIDAVSADESLIQNAIEHMPYVPAWLDRPFRNDGATPRQAIVNCPGFRQLVAAYKPIVDKAKRGGEFILHHNVMTREKSYEDAAGIIQKKAFSYKRLKDIGNGKHVRTWLGPYKGPAEQETAYLEMDFKGTLVSHKEIVEIEQLVDIFIKENLPELEGMQRIDNSTPAGYICDMLMKTYGIDGIVLSETADTPHDGSIFYVENQDAISNIRLMTNKPKDKGDAGTAAAAEYTILPQGAIFSQDPQSLVMEFCDERRNMREINSSWLPAVVGFGSARIPEGHPLYNEVMRFGALCYDANLLVRNGVGPGLMEAFSRGYIEARKAANVDKHSRNATQGSRIWLPFEQQVNQYAEDYYEVYHFAARKPGLIKNSLAIVAFPGGLGTIDEVLEAWLDGANVIFFGRDFWKPIIDSIYSSLIAVGLNDTLPYPVIVDTAEEAMNYIGKNGGKTLVSSWDQVTKDNAEFDRGMRTLSSWKPSVTIFGNAAGYNEIETLASSFVRHTASRGIPVRVCNSGRLMDAALSAAGGEKDMLQAVLRISGSGALSDSEKTLINIITVSDLPNYQILTTENSSSFIFFPGDLTVINSLFSIITVMQTGRIPKRPIILVGKKFWQPIMDSIIRSAKSYTPSLINENDKNLFKIVDTADELIKESAVPASEAAPRKTDPAAVPKASGLPEEPSPENAKPQNVRSFKEMIASGADEKTLSKALADILADVSQTKNTDRETRIAASLKDIEYAVRDSQVFVAAEGENPAGLVFVERDYRLAGLHAYNLAVSPGSWQRGLGTLLLHHVIKYCQEQGVELLTLETPASTAGKSGRQSATAFYRKYLKRNKIKFGTDKSDTRIKFIIRIPIRKHSIPQDTVEGDRTAPKVPSSTTLQMVPALKGIDAFSEFCSSILSETGADNMKVIDIAAGEGHFEENARKTPWGKDAEFVCIDKEDPPRSANVITMRLENMQYEDGAFDLATFNFAEPDTGIKSVRKGLQEAFRVLKNGGGIACTNFDSNKHGFALEDIRRALIDAGFDPNSVVEFYGNNIPFSYPKSEMMAMFRSELTYLIIARKKKEPMKTTEGDIAASKGPSPKNAAIPWTGAVKVGDENTPGQFPEKMERNPPEGQRGHGFAKRDKSPQSPEDKKFAYRILGARKGVHAPMPRKKKSEDIILIAGKWKDWFEKNPDCRQFPAIGDPKNSTFSNRICGRSPPFLMKHWPDFVMALHEAAGIPAFDLHTDIDENSAAGRMITSLYARYYTDWLIARVCIQHGSRISQYKVADILKMSGDKAKHYWPMALKIIEDPEKARMDRLKRLEWDDRSSRFKERDVSTERISRNEEMSAPPVADTRDALERAANLRMGIRGLESEARPVRNSLAEGNQLKEDDYTRLVGAYKALGREAMRLLDYFENLAEGANPDDSMRDIYQMVRDLYWGRLSSIASYIILPIVVSHLRQIKKPGAIQEGGALQQPVPEGANPESASPASETVTAVQDDQRKGPTLPDGNAIGAAGLFGRFATGKPKKDKASSRSTVPPKVRKALLELDDIRHDYGIDQRSLSRDSAEALLRYSLPGKIIAYDGKEFTIMYKFFGGEESVYIRLFIMDKKESLWIGFADFCVSVYNKYADMTIGFTNDNRFSLFPNAGGCAIYVNSRYRKVYEGIGTSLVGMAFRIAKEFGVDEFEISSQNERFWKGKIGLVDGIFYLSPAKMKKYGLKMPEIGIQEKHERWEKVVAKEVQGKILELADKVKSPEYLSKIKGEGEIEKSSGWDIVFDFRDTVYLALLNLRNQLYEPSAENFSYALRQMNLIIKLFDEMAKGPLNRKIALGKEYGYYTSDFAAKEVAVAILSSAKDKQFKSVHKKEIEKLRQDLNLIRKMFKAAIRGKAPAKKNPQNKRPPMGPRNHTPGEDADVPSVENPLPVPKPPVTYAELNGQNAAAEQTSGPSLIDASPNTTKNAEYYARELLAWGRMPGNERETYPVQPVWDSNPDMLGRLNKDGKIVTFTPEVYAYIEQEQQEVSKYENESKKLYRAIVLSQTDISEETKVWLDNDKATFSDFMKPLDAKRKDIILDEAEKAYSKCWETISIIHDYLRTTYRELYVTDALAKCLMSAELTLMANGREDRAALICQLARSRIRIKDGMPEDAASVNMRQILYSRDPEKKARNAVYIANFLAELALSENGKQMTPAGFTVAESCAKCAQALSEYGITGEFEQLVSKDAAMVEAGAAPKGPSPESTPGSTIDKFAWPLAQGIYMIPEDIAEVFFAPNDLMVTVAKLTEDQYEHAVRGAFDALCNAVPVINALAETGKSELKTRLFTPSNILIRVKAYWAGSMLTRGLSHELAHRAIDKHPGAANILEDAYVRILEDGLIGFNIAKIFSAYGPKGPGLRPSPNEFWAHWVSPGDDNVSEWLQLKNDIRSKGNNDRSILKALQLIHDQVATQVERERNEILPVIKDEMRRYTEERNYGDGPKSASPASKTATVPVSKRDAPKKAPPNDTRRYHTPPNDEDAIPGPEDAPVDLNQPTPRPRPAAAVETGVAPKEPSSENAVSDTKKPIHEMAEINLYGKIYSFPKDIIDHVRPARGKDAEMIADLSYRIQKIGMDHESDIDFYKLIAEKDEMDTCVWVYEEPDGVKGYIWAQPDGKGIVNILGIAVAVDSSDRGIGKALFAVMMKNMQSRGVGKFTVNILRSPAERLPLHFGFVPRNKYLGKVGIYDADFSAVVAEQQASGLSQIDASPNIIKVLDIGSGDGTGSYAHPSFGAVITDNLISPASMGGIRKQISDLLRNLNIISKIELIGVDINPVEVKAAKGKGNDVRLLDIFDDKATSVMFPDKTIDIITCYNPTEYVVNNAESAEIRRDNINFVNKLILVVKKLLNTQRLGEFWLQPRINPAPEGYSVSQDNDFPVVKKIFESAGYKVEIRKNAAGDFIVAKPVPETNPNLSPKAANTATEGRSKKARLVKFARAAYERDRTAYLKRHFGPEEMPFSECPGIYWNVSTANYDSVSIEFYDVNDLWLQENPATLIATISISQGEERIELRPWTNIPEAHSLRNAMPFICEQLKSLANVLGLDFVDSTGPDLSPVTPWAGAVKDFTVVPEGSPHASAAKDMTFPLTPAIIKSLSFTEKSVTKAEDVQEAVQLLVQGMKAGGFERPMIKFEPESGNILLPESLDQSSCAEFALGRIRITCFKVAAHARETDGALALPKAEEYVFSIASGSEVIGHGLLYSGHSGEVKFRYSIHGGPRVANEGGIDYRKKGYGKEALALLMAICLKGRLIKTPVCSFLYDYADDLRYPLSRAEFLAMEKFLHSAGFTGFGDEIRFIASHDWTVGELMDKWRDDVMSDLRSNDSLILKGFAEQMGLEYNTPYEKDRYKARLILLAEACASGDRDLLNGVKMLSDCIDDASVRKDLEDVIAQNSATRQSAPWTGVAEQTSSPSPSAASPNTTNSLYAIAKEAGIFIDSHVTEYQDAGLSSLCEGFAIEFARRCSRKNISAEVIYLDNHYFVRLPDQRLIIDILPNNGTSLMRTYAHRHKLDIVILQESSEDAKKIYGGFKLASSNDRTFKDRQARAIELAERIEKGNPPRSAIPESAPQDSAEQASGLSQSAASQLPPRGNIPDLTVIANEIDEDEVRVVGVAMMYKDIGIGSGDAMLCIGPGPIPEYPVYAAIAGARVDICQPKYYTGMEQHELMNDSIKRYKEQLADKYGVDLIGDRIDNESYVNNAQDANLPAKHYSYAQLIAVFDDPYNKDKSSLIKAVCNSLKDNANILVSTRTENVHHWIKLLSLYAQTQGYSSEIVRSYWTGEDEVYHIRLWRKANYGDGPKSASPASTVPEPAKEGTGLGLPQEPSSDTPLRISEERSIVLRNREGLHARPSQTVSELAQIIKDELNIGIYISRGQNGTEANDLTGLLSLGANYEDVLEVSAEEIGSPSMAGHAMRKVLTSILDLFEKLLSDGTALERGVRYSKGYLDKIKDLKRILHSPESATRSVAESGMVSAPIGASSGITKIILNRKEVTLEEMRAKIYEMCEGGYVFNALIDRENLEIGVIPNYIGNDKQHHDSIKSPSSMRDGVFLGFVSSDNEITMIPRMSPYGRPNSFYAEVWDNHIRFARFLMENGLPAEFRLSYDTREIFKDYRELALGITYEPKTIADLAYQRLSGNYGNGPKNASPASETATTPALASDLSQSDAFLLPLIDAEPTLEELQQDRENAVTPAQAENTAIDLRDMIIEETAPADVSSEKLIIALGTRWIPGYTKTSKPKELNELIISMRKFCEENGIPFIDKDDGELPDAINALRNQEKFSNAKVVVLAHKDSIDNELSGLQDDEKAFLFGVDDENLKENNFIRVVEMLKKAMDKAVADKDPQDGPDLPVKKIRKNFWIFIPNAEPVLNGDTLRRLYEIQKFA